MKIEVSESTPVQLNWMVAQAEGNVRLQYDSQEGLIINNILGWIPYRPSVAWQQGGPIIEREGISTVRDEGDDYWQAVTDANSGSMFGPGLCGNNFQCGPTPLIAAMRCYVASRLGAEVDVPDELV